MSPIVKHIANHRKCRQSSKMSPIIENVPNHRKCLQSFTTFAWLLALDLKKKNSRPKARDGHRYPCPALVFYDSGCCVSRAAAPEGTKSCRIQGESVHLSVCPSVRPSIFERPEPASERGLLGGGDMGKYGCTDSPCILQDFVPLGSLWAAAQNGFRN